jgi:hypothetical protein
MKLRLALVALLILAVAGGVIYLSRPPSSSSVAARSVSATAPEPVATPIAFPVDSNLKFEVLRDRVLTPYRLRPDRRMVLAIAEIRRLARVPDSTVSVQFATGGWSVRCGSRELGKLSELPDFAEMLDMLTEWARTQAWARGWSGNTGPDRPDLVRALDKLDAPAALREADRAWTAGSRDAALFRDAAHAYALLALETPDWAGSADAIAARALATLAYARALGAEDPKREACMLAEAMGYSAAARTWARQLPASDPLRLYVSGDDAGLERVAVAVTGSAHAAPRAAAKAAARSKPGASAKTRPATKAAAGARTPTAARTVAARPKSVSLEAPYLRLLDVASRGDYETWSNLLTGLDRPGVPSALVMASGLRIQDPEASRRVADKLLRALSPRPTGKAGTRRPSAATANLSFAQEILRTETTLAAQSPPGGGVLFAPDFARGERRILAYAALDRIGRQILESQGPAQITQGSSAGSSKGAGKRGAAFLRWYAHLASARMGRPDVAALRADVDSAAPGPSQALRSFEALRASVSADHPSLREAARDLARRMDSRPQHRATLATIAARDLGGLTIAERLGSSAAAALGTTDPTLLWRTRLRNDADSSRGDAGRGRDGHGKATEPVSGSALARRLEAHPTEWSAAERYATWLEGRRNYAAARGVLERWMTRTGGDSSSLERIDARTHIARLLQREGHPRRGLTVLGDLYRTGRFEAAERTALILQELKQPNQALAIAWAAHRSAPRLAAGRALLAELLWRQGNHDEAAKALGDGLGHPLSPDDWAHEIAPRYVGCFRTRQSEGLQAAEALLRAGWNDRSTFGAIPEALGDEGLHALAFELQSRLRPSGVDGLESAILAYGHLKAAKGEAAATEWLRGRVAEPDRDLLGILAYQEQCPELLWSMAPARLQGEVGEYCWLLRAAACMAVGPSHPHYAETVDRVSRARGAYHAEVAKYLLGLREESEVLSMVQTLRQRSELYFFAGLKAEQRGRLRDAADWYFMSVESDTGNNVESRWAMGRLREWAGQKGRGAPTPAQAQSPPV